MPSLMACLPASLIVSGVSKSGSPTVRRIMSSGSLRANLNGSGETWLARSAILGLEMFSSEFVHKTMLHKLKRKSID